MQNYKIHLIIFFLLFFTIINNSCKPSYPSIKYMPLDTDGKRTTIVKNDLKSYNELTSNGSTLYIEFTQLGNRKYSQISISLYTMNEYKYFKLHNIEFNFEDKNIIFNINKKYKLEQTKDIFFVEGSNEIINEVFYDYIFYTYNKVKIYLQNIFNKKDEDIGKAIELTLRINYSLDNEEIIIQEINYLVFIIKGVPQAPDWMYWLFPGM